MKEARQERAYTIDELVEDTGFDRRTIAYYTTIGLLPKVGRRGRGTTYPQTVLDRLRVIRRVRSEQQRGKLTDVTLKDIAGALSGMDERDIAALANSQAPGKRLATRLRHFRATGAATAPGDATDGQSDSHLAGFGRTSGAGDNAAHDATVIREELTQLLTQVDQRAKSQPGKGTTGETLYRVPITDDVLLTVRNLDKEDAGLVEKLASLLRRLTRRGT